MQTNISCSYKYIEEIELADLEIGESILANYVLA